MLRAALGDELAYIALCAASNTPPTVISPEESTAAVQACLAAEKSAKTGKIVKLPKAKS